MCYILTMNVAQTIYDLPKDLASNGLLKFSPSSDIVEQIATSTQLHDYHDMLLRLNCLINLDNMCMSQLQ